MSTYPEIKGFRVEILAADPSNLVKGQTWFNTTTGTLKYYNGSSTLTVTTS
jgi:hypothetical protein|tara:strand:- start:627 stop:779 length:153 start_codon:yes stop_codon:yes gene_type:complete